MNTTKRMLLFLLVILSILISACKTNVSRNDDGTLNLESAISQQELQEAIGSAIADPLVTNVTASLQQGYVSVSADHQRLNDSSKTDTLSFRLDLSVANGQLIASITDAQLDGNLIEQSRVDNWNQTIANRLSNFGERSENATLQSVSITPEQVIMLWNVSR